MQKHKYTQVGAANGVPAGQLLGAILEGTSVTQDHFASVALFHWTFLACTSVPPFMVHSIWAAPLMTSVDKYLEQRADVADCKPKSFNLGKVSPVISVTSDDVTPLLLLYFSSILTFTELISLSAPVICDRAV